MCLDFKPRVKQKTLFSYDLCQTKKIKKIKKKIKGARNPLDYISIIKNNKEWLKSLFEGTQKVGSKPLTTGAFGEMNLPYEESKHNTIWLKSHKNWPCFRIPKWDRNALKERGMQVTDSSLLVSIFQYFNK